MTLWFLRCLNPNLYSYDFNSLFTFYGNTKFKAPTAFKAYNFAPAGHSMHMIRTTTSLPHSLSVALKVHYLI